ncbi:IS110 family transposase [Yoonia sp. R2-816]|uniref:IS110 family transposase n=1 Tax=Yoonia sp. R2-816 TaxID=3342638 RepID=UPI003728DE55
MEYFVGLDVSLRSCALRIVDGRCKVCMEARQVSATLSAMRNKTDKTDARGIAQILRTGWFSPGHMKSREAHGVRALLSRRKALLKKTIDLANEVRGLLKIVGIRLPRSIPHGNFDRLVRPMIEMDDVLAHAIIPLLDERAVLFQHYLELDRRVKRAASQDEVCMRMMTVPGVGPIAALTLKSAIDYPTKFKKSRTVAAHFGLTPRRYQSGEYDNPGRISKAGDGNVRATLRAASNVLLMRNIGAPQIKSWGLRLMRTKGRRRAVVAVACKLAVILHRMWVDGTNFRQEQVGEQT